MEQNIDPALRDAPGTELFWPTVMEWYSNSQYSATRQWIIRAVDVYVFGNTSTKSFWIWIYVTLRNTNATHFVQGFKVFLRTDVADEDLGELQAAVDAVIHDRVALQQLMHHYGLPVTTWEWDEQDLQLRDERIQNAEIGVRRTIAENQRAHNDMTGQQPSELAAPHLESPDATVQFGLNRDTMMHEQSSEPATPLFSPFTPTGQYTHEQVTTAAQPLEPAAPHLAQSHFTNTNQPPQHASMVHQQPDHDSAPPPSDFSSTNKSFGYDVLVNQQAPLPAMSAARVISTMPTDVAATSMSATPAATPRPSMTAASWKKHFIDHDPSGPIGSNFTIIDNTHRGKGEQPAQGTLASNNTATASSFDSTPSHHPNAQSPFIAVPDMPVQPLADQTQADFVLSQLLALGEQQKAVTGKHRSLADEDPEVARKMHEAHALWKASQ